MDIVGFRTNDASKFELKKKERFYTLKALNKKGPDQNVSKNRIQVISIVTRKSVFMVSTRLYRHTRLLEA